jgi:V/A-type H+/Na+-transporting ATPase subunit D
MAAVKLTKNELRNQQTRLNQLKRYLPTLQLKKALLQAEVNETRHEIEKLEEELAAKQKLVEEFAPLLAQTLSIDIFTFTKVKEIKKRMENIAGCDVPIFEAAFFEDMTYDLFDTPVWLEAAIEGLRTLSYVHAEIIVVQERKVILEKELRDISIRVNLFEKVLIPRCEENIKMIKVFLGDLMLAAVSQAKVAKTKIEHHKKLSYTR